MYRNTALPVLLAKLCAVGATVLNPVRTSFSALAGTPAILSPAETALRAVLRATLATLAVVAKATFLFLDQTTSAGSLTPVCSEAYQNTNGEGSQ